MGINISSLFPINKSYGLFNGVPIARHYIDKYIDNIADKISGRVLEFGRPTYAAKLDCTYEIIDIDKVNKIATFHADICDDSVSLMKPDYYDIIICTAVLQLVDDPQKAVDNMYKMLKPGGHLILAEKSISKIDDWSGSVDRWRFTQHGMNYLLRNYMNANVSTFGNVYVVCAYLLGIPAEEIEPDKLMYNDPEYPLVNIAYARK